ncbi:MAG: phenylacetate--CoA ligase family protein [Polyangiaceae bacterium]|nr:phenylacetate--CoA ligase family protein [Polyangiaceae bacterium]
MRSTDARRGELLGPDPHAASAAELLRAYGDGALRVFPQLMAVPWLPKPLLDALVRRRRARLVRRAFADVPYYRALYRGAGFDERRVASAESFAQLPLLTKGALKSDGSAMLSRRAPSASRLLERRSSGSTGSPVRVFFDPLMELPRRAQELRVLAAHGVRPWHTQLVLDAPAHMAPRPFLMQRLGVWRRIPYPVWLSPEAALDEVERLAPDVVHGVLAGVRMLALAAEARGGFRFRPHRILTRGELLDSQTRWFIENALGAPVVDFYATEETGMIAWECPSRSGYHIDTDLVFVEIVREDGSPAPAGEVGEIVLTNLYQHTQPIIRYRVGDLGAIERSPCPCGRSLPLLTQLRGRKLDFLITPAGELRDPFRVMAVFEHVSGVRWFRVTQLELDRVDVALGYESGLTSEEKRATHRHILRELSELLGADMKFEVRDAGEFKVEIGEKAPLVKGLGSQSLEELARRGYTPRV